MGLETLAIVGLTAGAVGTGVSAYSQIQQGKAQQSLNNYNATVTQQAADYNADLTVATAGANAARIQQAADFNATVASLNAGVALKDAATIANLERGNNARVQASQRARIAASGVVGSTGSPLIVQATQAGFMEMRALEAERQGTIRASSILNESASDTRQATDQINLTKWQAEEQAKMERFSGRSQSALDRMQGNAARRAGSLNAAGTLLQGANRGIAQYRGVA